MAVTNLQLHRAFYSALSGEVEDALVVRCHPDIEVLSVFAAVGGTIYRGHSGVRRWRRDMRETWGPEFRVEPVEFFLAGERTLASVVLHGRGTQSGIEVEMPATGVAAWQDGLCISHHGYAHRADALAELGISDDALDPVDVERALRPRPR